MHTDDAFLRDESDEDADVLTVNNPDDDADEDDDDVEDSDDFGEKEPEW